jgi:phosphate-selective porin OprO/OprP
MSRPWSVLLLLLLCPPVAAAEGSLVVVQPAGKEPTLRLGGLLQGQAELGDRGDLRWDSANDRIFLRRARINLQGRFLEAFEFRLEADAAGTLAATSGLRLQLTDGYVDWKRYQAASVRVGQFKTPFGFEQLFSDPRLVTPERSLANDRLTLSRQSGVQVSGELLEGRLSYAAGLFNGTGANSNANDNDQFLYVGRLAGKPLPGLSLGANAYTSHDDAVPLGPEFRVDLTPSTPAPDNVFQGERSATGLDLQWQWKRLELWAEAMRVRFEPADAIPADRFRADGGYLQAGFYVVPGKLQAVVKVETFDPDDGADDDAVDTITAGANLLLKGDDLKLQAYYLRFDVPGAEGDDSKALLRLQLVF